MPKQFTAIFAFVELIVSIALVGITAICLARSCTGATTPWIDPECNDGTTSPLDRMAGAPALIIQ